MDSTVADDILVESEDGDGDNLEVDEYGVTIPPDPSMLHANGELYNLKDANQVLDAKEDLAEHRNKLTNGDLPKYENHSTNWGSGGRARLLYDQVRVDLALEYHEGRHNMDWKSQHGEAMKVCRIVAIKNRARY